MDKARIFDLPGLLTDMPNPRNAGFMKECGWRLICQQSVNNGRVEDPNPYVKPVDLSDYRKLGFGCGTWGVVYHERWFKRDGELLAKVANDMTADFLMIDAEISIQSGEDPTPLLDALDIYRGPKILTTLGAAYPPYTFPIQYDKFLERGYHVAPQAYASYDWASYNPKWVVEHSQKVGIPLDRLHLMMDSSSEYMPEPMGTGHPTLAAEIIQWLKEANYASPDIWIFMAEYNTDDFYRTLKEVTLRQVPAHPVTPIATRDEMLRLGHEQEARWDRQGLTQKQLQRQRITLADRILACSDAELYKIHRALDPLLFS